MAVLLDNFVQASAEMEREQQEREHQDKTRTDTVPPPRHTPTHAWRPSHGTTLHPNPPVPSLA